MVLTTAVRSIPTPTRWTGWCPVPCGRWGDLWGSDAIHHWRDAREPGEGQRRNGATPRPGGETNSLILPHIIPYLQTEWRESECVHWGCLGRQKHFANVTDNGSCLLSDSIIFSSSLDLYFDLTATFSHSCWCVPWHSWLETPWNIHDVSLRSCSDMCIHVHLFCTQIPSTMYSAYLCSL